MKTAFISFFIVFLLALPLQPQAEEGDSFFSNLFHKISMALTFSTSESDPLKKEDIIDPEDLKTLNHQKIREDLQQHIHDIHQVCKSQQNPLQKFEIFKSKITIFRDFLKDLLNHPRLSLESEFELVDVFEHIREDNFPLKAINKENQSLPEKIYLIQDIFKNFYYHYRNQPEDSPIKESWAQKILESIQCIDTPREPTKPQEKSKPYGQPI